MNARNGRPFGAKEKIMDQAYIVRDVEVTVTRDDFAKTTQVEWNFEGVLAPSMKTAALRVSQALTGWAKALGEVDEELVVEVIVTVQHPAGQAIKYIVDALFDGEIDDMVERYDDTNYGSRENVRGE